MLGRSGFDQVLDLLGVGSSRVRHQAPYATDRIVEPPLAATPGQ